MIPVKRIFLKIAVITCALACFTLAGSPVYALDPQENPDTAKLVFSGASLFNFYSSTIDSVLLKSLPDVKVNVEKTPFANIPPVLDDTIKNFTASSEEICGQMIDLDTDIEKNKILLQQSRYEEAMPVYAQAFDTLSQAAGNLNSIEQAARYTIAQFQFTAAAATGALTASYSIVLDRIQKLSDTLQLYRDILAEQQNEIVNRKSLKVPVITLAITPLQVFVGDKIDINGTLSVNGSPLAEREIAVLLNGSQSINFRTDAKGNYHGSLQVPFQYVSIIQVRSLYYPQTVDIGVYNSALSPVTALTVLFYKTKMVLTTDPKAYPGRETTVSGQLDYGSSPVLLKRDIEIALDNEPVRELAITGGFTEKLLLPVDISTGKHLITVTVLASGRYAPVSTDAVLNVVKAVPVISTKMPSVALIPGSFVINGKLNSEIGPFVAARVTVAFEGNKIDVISGADGTFTAAFKKNLGFGLFGTQSLDFKVTPQEPWQSPLSASYKVMTVYIVNCALFFIILALLAIILPRRLKFKNNNVRQKTVIQPLFISEISRPPVPAAPIVKNGRANREIQSNETDNRLFYWYRIVLQLVQKISGVLFKPNQTLREYIRDTGHTTGPAGKYLLEFTRIVEKALYSPYKISDADVKNGEQLARNVQESLKK